MTRPPQDQATRDRIVEDLDTTLFVEAGAGTGKTTAMVSRIVALIASGRMTIDRCVAITFTEAAAAELRVRVREELEKVWSSEQRDATERQLCQHALTEIDSARIDTIHGFASLLLRTWPIEAGLAPGFTVLDEIQQQLQTRERVRDWLDALEPHSPDGTTVRHALLLGLTSKHLIAATSALEENHDLLTRATSWPCAQPPTALELSGRAAGTLAELRELLSLCNDTDDRLWQRVESAQFAADRLGSAATDDEALLALQLLAGTKRGAAGQQGKWRRVNGENACLLVRERLRSLLDEVDACLGAQRAAALSEVLPLLRDLVLDGVEERRRGGVATFHDLLTWARDLLRDNAAVRLAAQSAWDRVIVDEFQDTDPLQVELAFLLAAVPGQAAADDWRRIALVPGKLTLVGDPKQSIYRFRRADIAAYQAVETAVRDNGGDTVHLTANFRSGSPVIDWVNHHFRKHMVASDEVQPAYVELHAHHVDRGGAVHRLGEAMEAAMPAVWQAEATAVARVARQAVDERWPVARSRNGETVTEAAGHDDICILMPTRTNLRRLERALQDEGVPYHVASGSLILATQEVRDLLSCLRAIDDPSDQVAVVAALRSPAFGIDDVELLRWRESGGGLDYQGPAAGDGDRMRESFAVLDALHRLRQEISPAALVERFVSERLLLAAATEDWRPTEVWRRYRYVAARARAFAATGRTTLREFLDWMEGMQRERVKDVGGASMDAAEGEVRLMTVHGAKGLEFPIVILTGGGSARRTEKADHIADRRRGTVHFSFGRLATEGYEAQQAEEQLRALAEQQRLMYVAATRARDHLVLCVFRPAGECPASQFATSLDTFADARELRPVSAPPPAPPVGATPEPEGSAAGDELAEERWLQHRAELIARHRALQVRSATGIAHADGTGEPEREVPAREEDVASYRRGRAGTSLGRAVHAVLQVVDLRTQAGIDDLARAQATAEGIPDRSGDVAELAGAACRSDAVTRAIQHGRYWREVPVGAEVDGVLLEGFIDLMYEEPGGSLVVVDYKTDRLTPGEVERRLDAYRLQGGSYALALERVTGRLVERVEFVFAPLGITRTLDDLAGAVSEVREALRLPVDHAGASE